MRFSKVGIIGTLSAAALALLVILPVLAADGQINKGTDPRFNIAVFDDIDAIEAQVSDTGGTPSVVDATDLFWVDDAAFDPEDTKVGVTLYVSNDSRFSFVSNGEPNTFADLRAVV